MTVETTDQVEPAASSGGGGRRALFAFVGAAVVALVVIGAVGAFALIRANSFGDRGASATAMPPDTEVYIDIDFGSLSDLDRLLQAFDGAFAAADLEPSLDGLIDRLDQELMTEFGIGVDDVTPWVGRDLGVGASGLAGLAEGQEPEILVAVSVRDGSGADAFIQRMIGILEARDGLSFSESTYQGQTLFAADDALEGQSVVVSRSDDMLLLGSTAAVVRLAIDAQAGPSLADDAEMDELLAALPDDRAVTVYISPNVFDSLLEGVGPIAGELPGVPAIPDTDIGAFAMSLALTDEGVQADFVQQIPDPGTDSLAAQAAGTAGSEELPDLLPADTFIYFGVAGDEGGLGDIDLEDALSQAGVPFGPADLAEIETALGFRIQEDLLAHLGGDFGLGVFPSDAPVFGLPDAPRVAGLAFVGITDPAAIAATVDKFVAATGAQGLVLERRTVGDDTLYAFAPEGVDLVAFGLVGDYLVFTSEAGRVGAAGATLADNALYGEAAAALPTAGQPLMFVDLQAALRTFDAPPDALRMLAPIKGMVAGADSDGSITRASLLTLIDY